MRDSKSSQLVNILNGPEFETLEQPLRQIIKFLIPSLKFGTPLDTVMIVMAGGTGMGKSTTVNRLFDDDDLCHTDPGMSRTQHVTECTKYLNIVNETFPLKAHLSLFDVPGIPDDARSEDPKKLKTIQEFRNKYGKLMERRGCLPSFVRREVFPNLVLLTFQADDPRILGETSKFKESLKALRDTKLVDLRYVNLIVVGTHAMALGSRKEYYEKKANAVRQRVTLVVQEVLRIERVKIVFIENDLGCFPNDKEEGCDFYSLPNGELSHYNLFEAMKDLFKKNNDDLGMLLTSWYFDFNVPERRDKASRKVIQFENQPMMDIVSAAGPLNNSDLEQMADQHVNNYNFFYFGYGYCPINITNTRRNLCRAK